MKGEIYYMISEIVQGAEQIETCDCKDCRKYDDFNKEIGNYFKTKKDAQLAIKKLKAFKRLKDKGFTIDGWTATIGDDYYMPSDVVIKLNYNGDHRKSYLEDVGEDLDLLFGGEDE